MNETDPPLPDIPERRYDRPPIVEALCEIYFVGSQWDATTPGIFYERVSKEYPQKTQLNQVGIEVQLTPEQAETRSLRGEPRMKFSREDNSRLLQLGRDLLVVNQLRPYPHYEVWREVVDTTLTTYRQLAKPTGIARFGVRYLNRISVPQPTIRMEDYFRVYPEVPHEFGAAHGAFMLQMVMRPQCAGHQLTLTLGLSAPERPENTEFLLDLYDVIELGGQDLFGRVRRFLDEAHVNIVHTFENTITQAARDLFGEIKK